MTPSTRRDLNYWVQWTKRLCLPRLWDETRPPPGWTRKGWARVNREIIPIFRLLSQTTKAEVAQAKEIAKRKP